MVELCLVFYKWTFLVKFNKNVKSGKYKRSRANKKQQIIKIAVCFISIILIHDIWCTTTLKCYYLIHPISWTHDCSNYYGFFWQYFQICSVISNILQIAVACCSLQNVHKHPVLNSRKITGSNTTGCIPMYRVNMAEMEPPSDTLKANKKHIK